MSNLFATDSIGDSIPHANGISRDMLGKICLNTENKAGSQ